MNSHLHYTDALNSDNFILFASAKVVLDQRLQNIFSKSNSVLLLLMPTCPFFNSCYQVRICFLGFMPSYSSSSLSCSHLPTASKPNPPYLKKADFHNALNAKLMFIGIKICLTNQDLLYISAPEMAWNMQTSTNNNSIHAQQSASLATNSHSFTSQFPYFLETLCP